MLKKSGCLRMFSLLCAASMFAGASAVTAEASVISSGQVVTAAPAVPEGAVPFDPSYYGAAYPDVTAAVGWDAQALMNHYVNFGMAEGRIPAPGAQPGTPVYGMVSSEPAASSETETAGTLEQANLQAGAEGFQPVPINQLANYSSLKKRMTDEEFAQAYQAALELVTPYAGFPIEEQLYGITKSIRERFDQGMNYSMTADHYNDPYGYFILGSASCAGCTRATGLCLNILGIPYEHVNENQYSHQWCRVNVNGTYWITDAYGLYCGPEPAPYTHPWF